MAEFILFVLTFVGIMTVSALVFGGWFLVMLIRGIGTFLGLRQVQPRAIGLHQSSIYAGTIGGSALAGWMGLKYGWQSPFWLVVGPMQVTVVLLTGAFGVHAALACPTAAHDASSSPSLTARRCRFAFRPATSATAHTPDVSPAPARIEIFKTSLRPVRLDVGRTLG